MGLDIFFGDDIRNALLAANEANAAMAAVAAEMGDVAKLRIYREGYKAALVTVALAFGIRPQIIDGDATEAMAAAIEGPSQWEILGPRKGVRR